MQDIENSEKPSLPSSETHNQLWMVPYERNPFFSGREEELQEIAALLTAGQNSTGGLALSGAGGIGKTQLVLEYAHRHREEYRHVFWVRAATRDTLNAAYEDIAHLLDLPAKRSQEQQMAIEAVKNWLANNHTWLLILDHVGDMSLARQYLPATFTGHLLLTIRSNITGKLLRRIKLKALTVEEGSRLLLRRCGIMQEESESAGRAPDPVANELARNIVRELEGLPLALHLAASYLVETHCNLSDYLKGLKRVHTGALKANDRTETSDPMTKAVHMACEKAARTGSPASALLYFCAFLAPDEIPETLIRASGQALGKPLQRLVSSPTKWTATLALLQKYALLERDTETQTLTMQCEVQATLQRMLPENEERVRAEQVVRALGSVFPHIEIDDWETWQCLLPHAAACAQLIERWNLELVEGAWMLHHAGWYLHTRGEYASTQAYEEKALALYRATLGNEHPSTAMLLNNLALTYEDRGKLKDAATLHQQALAIRRSILGEQHADTAASLYNLALIAHKQGKLAEAASLHRQALAIRRQLLGEQHTDTATSLTDLATIYHEQGKFDDAVSLHQQALAIRRKILGRKHSETLSILSSLAAACQAQGKFDEAIDWLRQALPARRGVEDNGQAERSAIFDALASVYLAQGKLDDAAFWLQQALVDQRSTGGREQPDLAQALEMLAIAYEEQGQYDKAEALYYQALAIYHQSYGEDHPDAARCSYNLALLYQDRKRIREALPLLQRALSIWQTHYGPDHPDTRKAREKQEQLIQQSQKTFLRRGPDAPQNEKSTGSGTFKNITRVIKRTRRSEQEKK